MSSAARSKEISYEEVKSRVASHQLEDNGDGVIVCHRCRTIWMDLSQVWQSGMCKDSLKRARH
jgi:hypothetical protein